MLKGVTSEVALRQKFTGRHASSRGARLGAAAADLWRRRFTLDGMIARYEAIIDEAVTMPMPDETRRSKLPRHLVSDGAEKAARLLRAMGVPDARLEALWKPGPTWPA